MKKHRTKKYYLSGSDSWDDCLTEIFFLCVYDVKNLLMSIKPLNVV
jgi:hypothetical protein